MGWCPTTCRHLYSALLPELLRPTPAISSGCTPAVAHELQRPAPANHAPRRNQRRQLAVRQAVCQQHHLQGRPDHRLLLGSQLSCTPGKDNANLAFIERIAAPWKQLHYHSVFLISKLSNRWQSQGVGMIVVPSIILTCPPTQKFLSTAAPKLQA